MDIYSPDLYVHSSIIQIRSVLMVVAIDSDSNLFFSLILTLTYANIPGLASKIIYFSMLLWTVLFPLNRWHWLFVTKILWLLHLWRTFGTKDFQNLLLSRLTWMRRNWSIRVDTKLVDNLVHSLIQKSSRLVHFSLSFEFSQNLSKFACVDGLLIWASRVSESILLYLKC